MRPPRDVPGLGVESTLFQAPLVVPVAVGRLLDGAAIAGIGPCYVFLLVLTKVPDFAKSIPCETWRDKSKRNVLSLYASPSLSLAVLCEMRKSIPIIM